MKKIDLFDILIFLFVVLFVYAATSKLIDHALFRAQIGKSLLIMRFAGWISWIVPFIEIIIALLLLVPRTQLVALYAFFSLMLTFTLYIVFILNFSPSVPCSCGGILSQMGWTEHMIFNIVVTVLAVLAIVLNKRRARKYEVFQYSEEAL